MSQNAKKSLLEDLDEILEYFKILIEIDALPNLEKAENVIESETV